MPTPTTVLPAPGRRRARPSASAAATLLAARMHHARKELLRACKKAKARATLLFVKRLRSLRERVARSGPDVPEKVLAARNKDIHKLEEDIANIKVITLETVIENTLRTAIESSDLSIKDELLSQLALKQPGGEVGDDQLSEEGSEVDEDGNEGSGNATKSDAVARERLVSRLQDSAELKAAVEAALVSFRTVAETQRTVGKRKRGEGGSGQPKRSKRSSEAGDDDDDVDEEDDDGSGLSRGSFDSDDDGPELLLDRLDETAGMSDISASDYGSDIAGDWDGDDSDDDDGDRRGRGRDSLGARHNLQSRPGRQAQPAKKHNRPGQRARRLC
ncbi:hypothetical protein HK405_010512, partial [Cladochytrium tenue]